MVKKRSELEKLKEDLIIFGIGAAALGIFVIGTRFGSTKVIEVVVKVSQTLDPTKFSLEDWQKIWWKEIWG